MARSSSKYVCQQCGYISPNFLGKCPECNTWGSLVEQIEQESRIKNRELRKANPGQVINLKDVEKQHYDRLSSGIGEFDRVLGGGIVRGSIVLIAGDPGIGKSTLLSHLALNVNETLYVAGEESASQIKLRIDRIKPNSSLKVLNEVDVDTISATIEQQKPSIVIIDSIQTIQTQDLNSAPGSVSQVRESAHRLQQIGKRLHVPIFIVGHVTKEGTIAGPRTLEHLVDVVLNLEGDPTSHFRILRGSKNRFGPTDEVGIFDMSEEGLKEVTNPSEVFLDEKINAPGSAIVATLTGLRPMLIEVQALVTKTNLPIPRRIGTGIDNNRLQLLVAVLSKRSRIPLYDQDIFVNVVGGIKLVEPAADLAICMAIISSFKDQPLNPKAVFISEVGLLGELRSTRNLKKRIDEAKRMGFTTPISYENAKTLDQAISKAF